MISSSVTILSSGEFEELDTSPSVEARLIERVTSNYFYKRCCKSSETLFLVHNGRSEVTNCSTMLSIKHKFEQGFPKAYRLGAGGRAGGVRRLDSTNGYSQIF